jgi:hypothetical protein
MARACEQNFLPGIDQGAIAPGNLLGRKLLIVDLLDLAEVETSVYEPRDVGATHYYHTPDGIQFVVRCGIASYERPGTGELLLVRKLETEQRAACGEQLLSDIQLHVSPLAHAISSREVL